MLVWRTAKYCSAYANRTNKYTKAIYRPEGVGPSNLIPDLHWLYCQRYNSVNCSLIQMYVMRARVCVGSLTRHFFLLPVETRERPEDMIEAVEMSNKETVNKTGINSKISFYSTNKHTHAREPNIGTRSIKIISEYLYWTQIRAHFHVCQFFFYTYI